MGNTKTWYVLNVNPRPWAVGPLSVGRRGSGGMYPQMGRNQELHAYEAALASTIVMEYPYLREYVDTNMLKKFPGLRRYVTGDTDAAKGRSLWAGAEVEMTFHFWQKIETAEVSGKKIKDKVADLTNMVKAAEDAMQGILLNNDVQVRAQRNVIYQRDEDVPEGLVIVSIGPFVGPDPDELPSFVWQRIQEIFAQNLDGIGDGTTTASLFDF